MTPMQIRDAMLNHFDRHKAICPEPLGQCKERHNFIAFMAHCAGVKTAADLAEMEQHLEMYNRECGENCGHNKEQP